MTPGDPGLRGAGPPARGYSALAAASLTIIGVALTTVGQPGASEFDDKIVTIVDAISRTAAREPIPPGASRPSPSTSADPTVPMVAVLYGLGSVSIFFAIAYLFRASARAGRDAAGATRDG